MEETNCPICNQLRVTSKRYPNKICDKCCNNCLTKNNEKIRFFNIDYTGGFVSIVNNKQGEEHDCYVNKIKCYADEARFGGIVISKVID